MITETLKAAEPVERPTPCEAYVLEKLCAGHTPQSIADMRRRAKRTIDFHIAALLRKRGASSVPVLVRSAIQDGSAPNGWKPRRTPCPLTPAELRVLHLKAQGLSTAETALALGVRKRTVDFHLARIYSKWEVQNCTQAILQGHLLGLFPDWP